MDDWCGSCSRQMVELFTCPYCGDAFCEWCLDIHVDVEHDEEEESGDA